MDTVERDLQKQAMAMVVVTEDMEVMGAMDMVDTVASDLPKLTLTTVTVDTEVGMEDMAATDMGDTVERDLLKLTVVDTVEVMVDVVTEDVDMEDVDMGDVDTESNLLASIIISKCLVDL